MTYGQLVSQYISEKYTLSQEVAIQRQRDSKPEEFAEYNAFCEECKRRAKANLEAVNEAEEKAEADRLAAVAEARAKHEADKAEREAERKAKEAKDGDETEK